MQHHHAYVYEGPLALFLPLSEDARKRFDFGDVNHPDVHARTWEKFGIDESRELVQLASLRTTSGRALFMLGISSITSEAQQALLKLFEEPQAGIIFILLVPHGVLLPTLRSRFLDYPRKVETGVSTAGQAAEFLSWPYAQRSAWISTFVKGADEEDMRENVRVFINGLEVELYAQFIKLASREVREGLEDIAHFRPYLSDRAPSLKMILEHFAATLPQISASIQEKSVRSGPLDQV